MSASVIVTNAVSAMLLPPLNLVLLCGFGLLLRRRWPWLGISLSILALLLLVVFSTQAGARLLLAPLEARTVVLVSGHGAGAEAIVVLGGGRISSAMEYGGKDIPSHVTLARLRYAARLQRETGLPLLVSGGAPDGSEESEAAVMARALRNDFMVPVKWIEGESRNTAENAVFSERILTQAGISKILLVTDGIHMSRSLAIFAKGGLGVVPAPTALLGRGNLRPIDFMPTGEGMRRAHYAMHEWVGLAWYWLRHGSAL